MLENEQSMCIILYLYASALPFSLVVIGMSLLVENASGVASSVV